MTGEIIVIPEIIVFVICITIYATLRLYFDKLMFTKITVHLSDVTKLWIRSKNSENNNNLDSKSISYRDTQEKPYDLNTQGYTNINGISVKPPGTIAKKKDGSV